MHKKAQAAMEFLMTYGWAILVVIAAVAALAYFGVLSPDKFLPTKCTLAPGLACIGHKVEASQATLVLSNGMGKDLTINTIDVAGCSGTVNLNIENGAQNTFTITGCSNGALKSRFSGDIVITYLEKDTLLNKTHYGSITARIE
ncbi:hypothetical protein J4209_00270 [Candidatus Woesearchaeota archaeon]|nr:hypothetical protein [Candidatus Woesearchaeota archaeon]